MQFNMPLTSRQHGSGGLGCGTLGFTESQLLIVEEEAHNPSDGRLLTTNVAKTQYVNVNTNSEILR